MTTTPHAPSNTPCALAALLSLAVTLGLVASLAGLADQQYQQVLAQQATPAHTAAASAVLPTQPRI